MAYDTARPAPLARIAHKKMEGARKKTELSPARFLHYGSPQAALAKDRRTPIAKTAGLQQNVLLPRAPEFKSRLMRDNDFHAHRVSRNSFSKGAVFDI
ncbi:hypothetical protein CE91St30_20840 [Raoultibacter timonensis]|uniref:Uncharacterized protein n=1 Tax=Raoultibacter timonensis TaxID=1907662 RepID=A0ABN6MJ94_9ACTN|nr:hypothetical protein CE91St30_20840 [Raoultibacter timonensis]BDF51354.1 hypothetical protein CE91St31_20840 [Raoultibacter timonensis]